MRHMATSQLISRREDGIRGMGYSIKPRNSRYAEQHMYETRGSSSLVVRESKSGIKNPKFPLGPLDLDHSLRIQRIFKIQSILASFIVIM
jgi:hypothetical protein